MTEHHPAPAASGREPTVLVVEDDFRIADFMVRGLSASGFLIYWVTTAEEALERIAVGDIDVQVLDLGLPDMDGLDVLRELIRSQRELPTVVVTARSDPKDRMIAESLGSAAISPSHSRGRICSRPFAPASPTPSRDLGRLRDP